MKSEIEKLKEIIENINKLIMQLEENIVIHKCIVEELEYDLLIAKKKLNFYTELYNEKI